MLDTTSEMVQRFWEVQRACRLLRHSWEVQKACRLLRHSWEVQKACRLLRHSWEANSFDAVFVVINRSWAYTEGSVPMLARIKHIYKTLHDEKLQKNVYRRHFYV